MENKDEVILIQVKITQDEVEQRVVALRAQLKGLRQEKAQVEKALSENRGNTDLQKQLKSTEQALKVTSAELKSQTKILDDYAKTQKLAEISMDKMRGVVQNTGATLSKSNADLIAYEMANKAVKLRVSELSAELTVENAVLKAQASSMDKLNETIAELENLYSGLSQAQRENADVGGKVLSTLSDLYRVQEKNQRVMDESRKGIREYIRDINVLGVSVGGTIDSFRSGVQGVSTFAKAIFTTRGALIALTAVPIVLVLTALVTLLTKSQKGMDFLEKATSAVSTVFSALTNKVIQVGEAIVGAFTTPRKALLELGNFVETNLINRFKAFGVILDAIRSGELTNITNGFIQLGTGVTDATGKLSKLTTEIGTVAKQGAAIATMNQKIRDEEAKLNVERARGNRLIETNKQIAEDATKSAGVRAAAARKAFAEEERLQLKEQALQQKRINVAKLEARTGQNTREQQAKIAEEEAKYEEIAAQSIGKRTELQNQLNSINAEAAAKAKEERIKVAQEQVADAETALLLARRKGENIIDIEAEVYRRQVELIQARAAAEKAAVEKGTGAAAQRRLIQERANSEILEATKQLALKVSEITYNAQINDIESTLALTRKGTKAELELRIEGIEVARNKEQAVVQASLNQLKESLQAKRISQQEYTKAVTDLEIESGNIVNTAARAISDARLEYAKAEVNKLAELKAKQLQVQLDLGDQTLATERRIAGERITLEAETQKKLLDLDLQYNQISQDEYDKAIESVNAKTLAARRELNKQIRLDALASHEQELEDRLAKVREGSKAELRIKQAQLDDDRLKEIANAKGIIDEIEKINDRYKTKQKKLQEAYDKSVYEKTVEIANQAIATFTTIVDAQAAQRLGALDAEQEAALSSAALSTEARTKLEEKFAKRREELENQINEKRKKVATAQNLINGAVAITKAFAELGPIAGAIASALILAQVAAQQVIIDNQKFASGGIINGPSHQQGGVKYQVGPRVIELEGGEAVINRRSTQQFYNQLSAINVAGGGRAFPGIISAPAVRSFDTTNLLPRYQAGGVLPNFDAGVIGNAVRDGMQGVNIRVAVDDINKVQADVKYAETMGSY